ncbi:MAG: TPM domain-containing protein [Oligoflexia bacterium]|nr:TPM domain-containing protein [Oligoflexia bacterium]
MNLSVIFLMFLFYISIFFILPFLFSKSSIMALEVSALKSPVNDYASILSDDVRKNIEKKLLQLHDLESTQVVVLTVPTLNGENLEEYSIKVVEKWQIGKHKNDNGVLLLIAKEERKVRIEVGRGLEGKLTDLVSGRIIREEIIPYFKQGNYDLGVISGVNAIIDVVKGEYQNERKSNSREITSNRLLILVGLIFGLLFWARGRGGVFINRGGGGSWRSGGGYSGGGGTFGGGGASGKW